MRVAVLLCCCVVGPAHARPHDRCNGGTTYDERGNEVITVCGVAPHEPLASGGSGSGGSAGAPGYHGASGGVRTTGPAGAESGSGAGPAAAPRPLSNQPQDCAGCQAEYEDELYRSGVTRQSCLRANQEMATGLCEREHLMPNGDMVDDFTCPPGGGRCSGPGIERCKDAYRRGMRGSAVTEAHSGGFSLTFQVVLNGSASRTETSSWNATTGYLLPCYQQANDISSAAMSERTFCSRRVVQAQEGVCTF
jgi:hypothetical protein